MVGAMTGQCSALSLRMRVSEGCEGVRRLAHGNCKGAKGAPRLAHREQKCDPLQAKTGDAWQADWLARYQCWYAYASLRGASMLHSHVCMPMHNTRSTSAHPPNVQQAMRVHVRVHIRMLCAYVHTLTSQM